MARWGSAPRGNSDSASRSNALWLSSNASTHALRESVLPRRPAASRRPVVSEVRVGRGSQVVADSPDGFADDGAEWAKCSDRAVAACCSAGEEARGAVVVARCGVDGGAVSEPGHSGDGNGRHWGGHGRFGGLRATRDALQCASVSGAASALGPLVHVCAVRRDRPVGVRVTTLTPNPPFGVRVVTLTPIPPPPEPAPPHPPPSSGNPGCTSAA